ncbi:PEP-utilizing enzyme [Micromonospora chalcea]
MRLGLVTAEGGPTSHTAILARTSASRPSSAVRASWTWPTARWPVSTARAASWWLASPPGRCAPSTRTGSRRSNAAPALKARTDQGRPSCRATGQHRLGP